MYMRTGNEDKLEKVILEIEPLLPALNGEKEKEEYYKGRHLLAIKALKKGSVKKAEELLAHLITDISSLYDYKLEGKAIYHDIYRSLAACEFKLGRTNDALTKLNTTRKLQLACEGQTHNVAMTETLIQTVCRTSGNKEEL